MRYVGHATLNGFAGIRFSSGSQLFAACRSNVTSYGHDAKLQQVRDGGRSPAGAPESIRSIPWAGAFVSLSLRTLREPFLPHRVDMPGELGAIFLFKSRINRLG
jgi:hypothetical protein